LPCLLLSGCGARDEREINRDLVRVLDADLKAMADETRAGDPKAALDRPYYRVDAYTVTKESYRFVRKVEVTFYYLPVRMKQIRKYRYSILGDRWERYYKEMEYDLPKPRIRGS
jgi:hypothetical protein